ncbi:phosphotransferase [Oceanobacillus luteolus]|uniref:Phosphotransferase n=1 Tax=Oceanobacillus luteolus TaxID=1274358 RepID=A0ABW4HTT1_9BACI
MENKFAEIYDNYPLEEIKSIYKIGNCTNDVYRLKTTGKDYIVKRFKRKKKNIITSINLQSIMSNYSLSPSIVTTKHGSNYMLVNEETFFIQEFLENEKNINDKLNFYTIFSSVARMYNLLDKINIKLPKLQEVNKLYSISDNELVLDFYKFKKDIKMSLDLIEVSRKSTTKAELIHGDLRPDNILISNNNTYVIDFESIKYGNRDEEILKFLILFSRYNQENLLYYISFVSKKFGYLNNMVDTVYSLLKQMLLNNFVEKNYIILSNKYLNYTIDEHKFIILTCLKLLEEKNVFNGG